VAGNPAKIIFMQGSFEMVRYYGTENDPERAASLALREVCLPKRRYVVSVKHDMVLR